MTFTPTVDVGNLLTLLGMAATIFWFVAKMTTDIKLLIAEVAAIKIDVAKFGDALITIARQDERLAAGDVRANVLRQNLDAINDRLTVVERTLRVTDARFPRRHTPGGSQSSD